MGFREGDVPPVDAQTFPQLAYRERIQALARFWAEYGFGAPKMVGMIYIVKLLVLYCVGGVLVATLTSDLAPLHPKQWWDEPIVWEKLVLWTMMLETIGLAGSWGPLAGHFKPMTGGITYWARPKTIRLPPWPKVVPFTAGDERTPVDVAIYLLLILSFVLALALPGTGSSSLTDAIGRGHQGLVATASLVPIIVLLVTIGLRDKVVFLAARSEQYLPAIVFMSFFPFVDMIVAAKLLIVTVWCCAAFSKLGKHFDCVIPPMVSSTPWIASKALRRSLYKDFPEDLRPSWGAVRLAHVGGTVVEFLTPLVLLFSHNATLTLVAALVMIAFHLFIISTFPLAVPLEWNALFMFLTVFLFLGYPPHEGFGVGDMDTVLLVVTLAGLLFFPVLGNLRPDLVSFLPSMRQYAGNWASGMWALAPGAELQLDEHIVKPAKMQRQQLIADYGDEQAEVVMHQLLGWRSLHSQGRGLNSVMMNTLGGDIDLYTLREAEFSCNAIIGFNFGDGHLHRETLIEAIQKRCRFQPGEFVVAWVESEPALRGRQAYWVMDAAVGKVETGTWSVSDCVAEQPWLPNGPIDYKVDWKLEGYERVSHTSGTTGQPAEGAYVTATAGTGQPAA